ncbi:APH(3'') family aminoglycoside O-phosphotransferase [Streptomyces sp. ME01-18a]|uniref:APH(3'') family aminoglycoside O-phosphotransferase n=1 Tax=unclassified Streptomyces TaxID=2593676 RepID=UPI0029A7DD17|nr:MULTISPECIES: APH(3'') family aminoglycoside O-phosphotransferase [unclassified Streptomyces]MDX3427428.1 APH(3'') family aminoglycoside O-phosphotransferase [Streptomyces sp. ME01-18a]MDX3685254.1 APH(3'') family aminoglycoside O-phosphotransferase [Streptomyces sp. AK04-4c]
MRDRRGTQAVSPVLLGVDDSGWVPVTAGESGATVFRSADATRYAKCVPAADAADLKAERDRVAWLSGQGVPGPRVLDWQSGDAGACLVTAAVSGVPADQVPAEDLRVAWERIADAVRRLHGTPVSRCPFRRGLDAMVAVARDVVARDAVNAEFLPVDQQRTPATELLGRLTRQIPQRREQEAADTVVCHGDLCLPNIILDPQTLDVSGFVDLGRLGLADRYADLALLLANARETWTGEEQARAADTAFAERYGIDLDHDRLRFYLHLDPLTWG